MGKIFSSKRTGIPCIVKSVPYVRVFLFHIFKCFDVKEHVCSFRGNFYLYIENLAEPNFDFISDFREYLNILFGKKKSSVYFQRFGFFVTKNDV